MNTLRLPFKKIEVAELVDHLDRYGHFSTEPGTCGFFLCQQGWARIQLDSCIHELHPGDVYVYTPSAYLRLLDHSDDIGGVITKSTLNAVLPLLTSSVLPQEIISLPAHPFFSLSEAEQQRLRLFTELIESCMADLSEEESIAKVQQRQLETLTESYIYELIQSYLKQHTPAPGQQSRRSDVVEQFILSLFIHYKRERSIAFYAEQQHLSVRYFSQLIKEETGRSANEWISDMVVSYIKQALAYSQQSIKQISADFNFPDQSVFGKYFKQHTGLSPKDYRKEKVA